MLARVNGYFSCPSSSEAYSRGLHDAHGVRRTHQKRVLFRARYVIRARTRSALSSAPSTQP